MGNLWREETHGYVSGLQLQSPRSDARVAEMLLLGSDDVSQLSRQCWTRVSETPVEISGRFPPCDRLWFGSSSGAKPGEAAPTRVTPSVKEGPAARREQRSGWKWLLRNDVTARNRTLVWKDAESGRTGAWLWERVQQRVPLVVCLRWSKMSRAKISSSACPLNLRDMQRKRTCNAGAETRTLRN